MTISLSQKTTNMLEIWSNKNEKCIPVATVDLKNSTQSKTKTPTGTLFVINYPNDNLHIFIFDDKKRIEIDNRYGQLMMFKEGINEDTLSIYQRWNNLVVYPKRSVLKSNNVIVDDKTRRHSNTSNKIKLAVLAALGTILGAASIYTYHKITSQTPMVEQNTQKVR